MSGVETSESGIQGVTAVRFRHMKALPELIIVADRGRMIAYRNTGGTSFEVVDSMQIEEGRSKLSEQVTDNAGRFSSRATQGGGAAESMTLVAELDTRIFEKLAAAITALCATHKPRTWAFAAPSEINGAILDGLAAELKDRLRLNLDKDLTHFPAGKLKAYLEEHNG